MKPEQKERTGILPFLHSFNRYFEVNGRQVDRLKLILQHGILSPKKADELGVPFQRLPVFNPSVPDYMSLVFIYSTEKRNGRPTPGNISLFFDLDLEVIFPEQMIKQHGKAWVIGSEGELYVKDKIPAQKIKKIKTYGQDKDEIERMVSEFVAHPVLLEIK